MIDWFHREVQETRRTMHLESVKDVAVQKEDDKVDKDEEEQIEGEVQQGKTSKRRTRKKTTKARWKKELEDSTS